jgi:hypothetical protein
MTRQMNSISIYKASLYLFIYEYSQAFKEYPESMETVRACLIGWLIDSFDWLIVLFSAFRLAVYEWALRGRRPTPLLSMHHILKIVITLKICVHSTLMHMYTLLQLNYTTTVIMIMMNYETIMIIIIMIMTIMHIVLYV